jgi:hypothetical protein
MAEQSGSTKRDLWSRARREPADEAAGLAAETATGDRLNHQTKTPRKGSFCLVIAGYRTKVSPSAPTESPARNFNQVAKKDKQDNNIVNDASS